MVFLVTIGILTHYGWAIATQVHLFTLPQNAPSALHSVKTRYALILKGFAPQPIPFFISNAVFHPGGGAK